MSVAWLRSVMRTDKPSLPARAVRCGLAGLTPFYAAIMATRNLAFDLGLRRVEFLARPVISVGNITAGGTGKTPMVFELVRRLRAMGQEPAVLLRGYRANEFGSDEATMLADELGNQVLIRANPNRIAGSQSVLRARPQVCVFVLDDGFQHRVVHRDLDVVLIDATVPFGFNHLLPRGLLREPLRYLRRADTVIVTRANQVTAAQLTWIDRRIERITGRLPAAHACHQWVAFRAAQSACVPLDALRDRRVIGACGIGNPDSFTTDLAKHVADVLGCHVMADHHRYSRDEVAAVLSDAKARGGDAIVTTEKDWVKWRHLIDGIPAGLIDDLPIYRPVVKMAFLDGNKTIDRLLHQCLHNWRAMPK